MVTSDKPSSARGHFNMSTYKLYALGDYVANIWLYGLTDNYSTQVVSYFTCFSFLTLNKDCRVSLNIAASSVSMHEQIKSSHLPDKQANITGSSKFCKRFESDTQAQQVVREWDHTDTWRRLRYQLMQVSPCPQCHLKNTTTCLCLVDIL